MSIELNHTIVHASDKHASARFLADILGVPVGEEAGPFVPVELSNAVSLDFATTSDVTTQHYAFLVNDEEFDAAFARVTDAGVEYYADPGGGHPGEINRRWGGRGVYFHDPDGHAMELMTRTP